MKEPVFVDSNIWIIVHDKIPTSGFTSPRLAAGEPRVSTTLRAVEIVSAKSNNYSYSPSMLNQNTLANTLSMGYIYFIAAQL